MASGVKVDDECVKAFQEVKLKRKYRYVVFSLNNSNDAIVVERQCPVSNEGDLSAKAKYEGFLDVLRAKKDGGDCCYALYDVNYNRPNGQPRQRMVLIAWCPSNASVKKKMLYASSKSYLREKLAGINADVQGTDIEEVSWDAVMDKLEGLEKYL